MDGLGVTTTMLTEYGMTRGQSVSVARLSLRLGAGVDRHAHDEHQVALAESGSFNIRVGDRAWGVLPGQAVWIPAGHEHDLIAVSELRLTCAYLDPDECRAPEQPQVFTPGGLLRELVQRLARADLDDDQACRLRAVLVDVVESPGTTKSSLPVPRHHGARAVARALLANPADQRRLAEWATTVFVSERTLQRAFVAETGLSFACWRRMVRLAGSA